MDNKTPNIIPVKEEVIVPVKKPTKPIYVPKFTDDKCCLLLATSDEFKAILLRNQKKEEDQLNDDNDIPEFVEEIEHSELISNCYSGPQKSLKEVKEDIIIPIILNKKYSLECKKALHHEEIVQSNEGSNCIEEVECKVESSQTFSSPSKQMEDDITEISCGSTLNNKKLSKPKQSKLRNLSNYFKKKVSQEPTSSLDTPANDKNKNENMTNNTPSFFERMSFGKGQKATKENQYHNAKDSKEQTDKTFFNDLRSGESQTSAEFIKTSCKVDTTKHLANENEWSNMTAHYAVGQYIDSPEVNKSSLAQNDVVIAIDFGTAFSGYAYSFLNDPEQTIYMMGKWENGDPGVINQKTPTTLLLTPTGEFDSFGFTARNNYQDLSPEEAKEWMLFDHFKMSLYKANSCNMNTTIEAVNGKKFSAFKAISMTLSFFKSHATKELSAQTGNQLSDKNIVWVLTVPAIWSSPAKQFMRLAAYQAGLASPERADKLIVALEPEAAAIHICRLRKHQLVPDKPVLFDFHKFKVAREPVVEQKLIEEFKKKCRYIILDCGGGTVDITVHEMDADTGLIHELQAASGGPYGATNIDLEFRILLCKIFGKDFIDSFQMNCPNGWISLMMFFESRKRAADPMKPSSLNVALPFSFLEHFRKTQGSTADQAIKHYGDPEVQWSPQGMLKLSQQSMRRFFKPCTDKIEECIANIIKNVKGIQYIFMVGGLSESPVLQHAIRSLCAELCGPSVKVIIPQEASLAVVKGAVSFGLHPEILTARRSKMTYGAAVLNVFDSSKHLQSKLVNKEGRKWCKDVFDVFVRAEELINCGHVVERSYVTADPKQTKMFVGIYCSSNQHPAYVTDPDVTKCGNICLDLEPSSVEISQRFVRVRMEFAATEIKVTAVDATSGQHVDSSIDFLNF